MPTQSIAQQVGLSGQTAHYAVGFGLGIATPSLVMPAILGTINDISTHAWGVALGQNEATLITILTTLAVVGIARALGIPTPAPQSVALPVQIASGEPAAPVPMQVGELHQHLQVEALHVSPSPSSAPTPAPAPAPMFTDARVTGGYTYPISPAAPAAPAAPAGAQPDPLPQT
jgi:hypothetical protein